MWRFFKMVRVCKILRLANEWHCGVTASGV
jgi:hypothetical protein